MATGDIDRIEWPFLTGNPLSAQKDAPAQAPGTRRTVRNVWGSTNLVRYFSNFAADPAHRAFATCSQPALPQLGAMLDDHIVDLAVARKLLAPRSRAHASEHESAARARPGGAQTRRRVARRSQNPRRRYPCRKRAPGIGDPLSAAHSGCREISLRGQELSNPPRRAQAQRPDQGDARGADKVHQAQ